MSKFFKTNIPHKDFYIVSFLYKAELPYILFIHGGPGLNSAVLECLIENEEIFSSLECNIILYDQRNCGRSIRSEMTVLHKHNIDDLHEMVTYLSQVQNFKIACIAGHSYGAKLLYDYYKKYDAKYPGIFISTAESITIPRVNNLMLDLNYLKRTHPEKYQEIVKDMDTLDSDNLWKISEELAPVFQENKERIYFYWANLDCMNRVAEIQSKSEIQLNKDVFASVRQDLYMDDSNFSVAIDELSIRKEWINGVQDLVMNGPSGAFSNKYQFKSFFKSAHYPHIEEEEKFCQLVNGFINSNG
jgi:proline iminopeptidase